MGRQYNYNFSKSKYKAVKQSYNGYNYDSKLEANYASQLDLLIMAKEVEKWERQYKISIDVNDVHICNYFIDFKVWFTDGRVEYHEVKGYETEVWKMKWKLSKALYTDNNFVLIK
jgi:hypothetical protein